MLFGINLDIFDLTSDDTLTSLRLSMMLFCLHVVSSIEVPVLLSTREGFCRIRRLSTGV